MQNSLEKLDNHRNNIILSGTKIFNVILSNNLLIFPDFYCPCTSYIQEKSCNTGNNSICITTQKKPCSFPLLQRWEQGSFHYRMKNVTQATRMALAMPHRALVNADMDLVRLSTFVSVLVILCPYSSCFLSASLFHSSKPSKRWVLLLARASISMIFSLAFWIRSCSSIFPTSYAGIRSFTFTAAVTTPF